MVRAVTSGLVFFYYDDSSRSQETVRNLLESFRGYFQGDGYTVYNDFPPQKNTMLNLKDSNKFIPVTRIVV